jgi:hypothetical protein
MGRESRRKGDEEGWANTMGRIAELKVRKAGGSWSVSVIVLTDMLAWALWTIHGCGG